MEQNPDIAEIFQVSQRTSVPLGDLLGSPLVGIVQGQAQAAQATTEFIEKIGFNGTYSAEGELGNLRMISFLYNKTNAQGEQETQRVEVPLLSLVNVPYIEVKDADLEYAIKVAAIQNQANQPIDKNDAESARLNSLLAPQKAALSATLGSLKDSAKNTRGDLQMKMTMRVEKVPLPDRVQAFYERIHQQARQTTISAPLDYLPSSDVIAAYGARKMSSQRSDAIMKVQRSSDQASQQVDTLAEAFTFGGQASLRLQQMYNQANNNLGTWLETTVDVAPELTEEGIFYNQQHFMQSNKALRFEEGFDIYTIGGFLFKADLKFHYLYYLQEAGSISRHQKQAFTYSYDGTQSTRSTNDPLTLGKTIFAQSIQANELKVWERNEQNGLDLLIDANDTNLSFPVENKFYIGTSLRNNLPVSPYLHGYVDAIIITKPLSEQARLDFTNLLHQFYVG